MEDFVRNKDFDIKINDPRTNYLKFSEHFKNSIILRSDNHGTITSVGYSWPSNPNFILSLLLKAGHVEFMPELMYCMITSNDWKAGFIDKTLDEYFEIFTSRYSGYLKKEMDFLPHDLYDSIFLYENF
jgi:hypothetical protein